MASVSLHTWPRQSASSSRKDDRKGLAAVTPGSARRLKHIPAVLTTRWTLVTRSRGDLIAAFVATPPAGRQDTARDAELAVNLGNVDSVDPQRAKDASANIP